MHKINRREFNKQALSTAVSFSVLQHFFASEALADKPIEVAQKWLATIHEMAKDLRAKKITQQQWQTQVEVLLGQVDINDLLKRIQFNEQLPFYQYRSQIGIDFKMDINAIEGMERFAMGSRIWALKKGGSVIPHGHVYLASCFVMLGGYCHGRHYDKLHEEKDHYLIKPTIDRTFKTGEHSTITDYRDNIHWFTGISDYSYILNLHMRNLEPGPKKSGRVFLDPLGPQDSKGNIIAKKMTKKECKNKFSS